MQHFLFYLLCHGTVAASKGRVPLRAFRVRASAERELELELLESADSPDEESPSQILTSIWQNSKFALSEPAANDLNFSWTESRFLFGCSH